MADGRSTLDLFGRGFVLLRLGERAPAADALVDAARRRSLVRPDGHVAWRGDATLALVDRGA